MRRFIRTRLVIWVISVLTFVSGLTILVHLFVHPKKYQRIVVAAIEDRLHRQVSFESVGVDVWTGLGLRLSGVQVSENPPEAGHPFLSVKSLRVHVALLPLLHRRLVINRILIDRPSVAIVRDRNGRLSIGNLFAKHEPKAQRVVSGGEDFTSLLVARTEIRKGEVKFVDYYPGGNASLVTVSNLRMDVEDLSYGQTPRATFRAEVDAYGGRWQIAGDATFDGGPTFTLKTSARDVPLERLSEVVPSTKGASASGAGPRMTGVLDAQAQFRGRGTDIRAWEKTLVGSGRVTLRNGRMPSSNIMEAVIRSLLGLFGRIIPVRQNMTLSEPVTIERFDQLFTVRDGRVRTENIHLVTSDYVLTGAGSFGLDSTLDYNTVVRFTATGTQKMITVVSLPVLDQTFKTLPPIPVRVSGTLKTPRIRPDMSGIPVGKVPGLTGGAEAIKEGIGSGARGIRSGLGRLLGRHPERERKK
jgi:uncharacterized protein involved in outer membrane biogenesis